MWSGSDNVYLSRPSGKGPIIKHNTFNRAKFRLGKRHGHIYTVPRDEYIKSKDKLATLCTRKHHSLELNK